MASPLPSFCITYLRCCRFRLIFNLFNTNNLNLIISMRQFCLFILLTATIYGSDLKLVHLFDMSGDYRGFFFLLVGLLLFRGLSKLVLLNLFKSIQKEVIYFLFAFH